MIVDMSAATLAIAVAAATSPAEADDGADGAPPADRPVREAATCTEPPDQDEEPMNLEGAPDERGRASLRPRVEWTRSAGDRAAMFNLLEAQGDAKSDVDTPQLVDWMATRAGLVLPPPTLAPGRSTTPSVRSELGLRTELRFGMVHVRAEGGARLDARGTDDDALASLRFSPRGRMQLEARPHEQIHLGVEFSHRDERGVDALASHTRGLASVRFGF